MKKLIYLAILITSLICCLSVFISAPQAHAEESNPLSEFIYSVKDEHAEILGYVGTNVRVVVPSHINGKPVTVVKLGNSYYDSNAHNFEYVRFITLPETIVRLGSFAFGGYGMLQEVKGLEYVQELDECVFAGCGLSEAHFSTALRKLAPDAFNASQLLKKLSIPDDIQYDASSLDLSGVEELTLLRGNSDPTIKVVDDVLFSADGKQLLFVLPSMHKNYYRIPEGTEELISNALGYNSFADEYEFPRSLRNISTNMVYPSGLTMAVHAGSYAHTYFEEYNKTDGLDDVKIRVIEEDGGEGVQDLVDGIIAEVITENMSDLQKARALHDWICQNGSYDYTYTNSQAIHILSGGSGLCDAYARAYCVLLDAVGISGRWVPCTLAGESHAINAVLLDGEWYLVDCTNDDGGFGDPDELFCFNADVFYQYYTINSDLVTLYHSDEMVQKANSLKYYAPLWSGRMDSARAALAKAIQEQLNNGETLFTVSLQNDALSGIPAQALCSLMAQAEWTVNGCTYALDCFTVDGQTYECYLYSPENLHMYRYETDENGVTLTEYKGNAQIVEVPAELNGLPVVALKGTFENNQTIQRVVLPEGLQAIHGRTFKNCIALEEINFPATLQKIGDFAFDGCLSLRSTVNLPNSLTELGYYAFRNCVSISAARVPGTIRSMGDEVFSSCSSLNDVVLKEGFSRIPSGTFFGCISLKHLALPQSLTAIDSTAFSRSNIVSLTLPANVQKVDWSAFVWAEKLKELSVSEANPYLAAEGNMLIRKDTKCLIAVPCGVGASVTIPAGVEEIGEYAFSMNSVVRSVRIPGSVRVIHDHAFQAATELEQVYIEDGLEEIGDFAFAALHVSAIRSNHESGTVVCGTSPSLSSIRTLRLPETLASMGYGALLGNYYLEKLRLPASLTRLDQAIIDYPQDIYVPETITYIAPQEMASVNGVHVIHGIPGTYAETYAAENGYIFVDESKKLTLNREQMQMVLQETETLVILMADGQQATMPDDEVEWRSSDACVTVDNGRLTAVSYGTAEITATWQEYTGRCTVEVINVDNAMSEVPRMDCTMHVGDAKYIPTELYEVDLNEFVVWTASPSGILDLQKLSNGYLYVSAIGPGNCTLTAVLPNGDSASAVFEVLGTAFDDESDWSPSDPVSFLYTTEGRAAVPLDDILTAVGLQGKVTEAVSGNENLFSISNETGEWIVHVYCAFADPVWLRIKINDLIYEIAISNLSEIYTLFFDHGDGSLPEVQYVAEGMNVAVPAPVRDGYVFLSWYSDHSVFDPTAPITESLTLTARWLDARPMAVTVIMPNDLKIIEKYAFSGTPVSAVQVPDTCTHIGAYAFSDCGNLRQVHIPSGCTVEANAFDGCTDLLIFGKTGSSAEAYANDHANCAFVEE